MATLVYIEFFAGNVKRGFWCGDKSISLMRQKETVSIKTVVLFGIFPIFFVSLLTLFFGIAGNLLKRLFFRCL